MKLSEKLSCKWNLVTIALTTFPQDLMHVHVDVDCLLNQILNTLLFLCDKTLSLLLLCTNKLKLTWKSFFKKKPKCLNFLKKKIEMLLHYVRMSINLFRDKIV